MSRLTNIPEAEARPGDRIGDLVVREPQTNASALSVDKHLTKLGKPYDALLVLQGGALRAIYTAGVLDTFLDAGIAFKDVVGISAGTLMGLDYVIGARGAAAYQNLVYAGDPRYMGLRDLVREQRIFSFDFMFNEVANYLIPYDYERFFSSPMHLTAIASDCEAGVPAYLDLSAPGTTVAHVEEAAAASSSMPLLSRPIYIDGCPYLDGGITDPIGLGPAIDAVAQGRKVVFVSTRERGFAKGPETKRMRRMYRTAYARWPEFAERLCEMNALHDRQLQEVDMLAAQGLAFVIHPIVPPKVSHTTKDASKLRALYEQGIYEAACALPALLAYLEN